MPSIHSLVFLARNARAIIKTLFRLKTWERNAKRIPLLYDCLREQMENLRNYLTSCNSTYCNTQVCYIARSWKTTRRRRHWIQFAKTTRLCMVTSISGWTTNSNWYKMECYFSISTDRNTELSSFLDEIITEIKRIANPRFVGSISHIFIFR